MGAYQNPEQVKDYTMDVAKAWSNATNTVVEGIVKLGDQKTNFYEAKIKEYNENKVEVKKVQQGLYKTMDQMTQGYEGADFRKTFDADVQMYADISLRLANKTSTDEAQDMKDLAQIEGVIGLTKKGIELQMSYIPNFKKKYALGSLPGGFDAVQAMDDKGNSLINHFQSLDGGIPAKKDIKILRDERGMPIDVQFLSKGNLGGKSWEGAVNASALKKSNDFGVDVIPDIPDQSKILGEQLAATNLVQKVNVTDPQTGVTTPKIIGPADNFYTPTMEKSGKSVGGMINEQKVGKFNKTQYIEKLKEDEVFKSNIQALIANPQKAAALMNSSGFRPSTDTAEYKASDYFNPSPTQTKVLADRLAEYYASQQPKERLMLNELGQPVTMQRKMSPEESIDERISIELEKAPWKEGDKEKIIKTSTGIIKVIRDSKDPEKYTYTIKAK